MKEDPGGEQDTRPAGGEWRKELEEGGEEERMEVHGRRTRGAGCRRKKDAGRKRGEKQ